MISTFGTILESPSDHQQMAPMKTLLLVLTIMFASTAFLKTQAQPPIVWQRAVGGGLADVASSIIELADGSVVCLGTTNSNNGDITDLNGLDDMLLFRLSAVGDLEWSTTLGGSLFEFGNDVCATLDGGFLVVGSTRSNNGDVSGNHGQDDAWVVKLDDSGAIEWQRALGGSSNDAARSAICNDDGTYTVVGTTGSNNGDVAGNHGGLSDVWVVKLDGTGTLLWQHCYGGSAQDYPTNIASVSNGGFVVSGGTASTNGDITNNQGNVDAWVLKLNSSGELEWQRTIGGSDFESGDGLSISSNGDILLAGFTTSNDGDVSENIGLSDVWVVRLSPEGLLLWEASFGGTQGDAALALTEADDSTILVCGQTSSVDVDVAFSNGQVDFWLLNLTSEGELVWQRTYGGSQWDIANAIVQTDDGGFVLAGKTSSTNGDVSGNHGGNYDAWVLKVGEGTVDVGQYESTTSEVFPNPSDGLAYMRLEQQLRGAHLSLEDVNGRPVSDFGYTNNGELLKIDLSSQAAGVYYLSIHTPDCIKVQRVVVSDH